MYNLVIWNRFLIKKKKNVNIKVPAINKLLELKWWSSYSAVRDVCDTPSRWLECYRFVTWNDTAQLLSFCDATQLKIGHGSRFHAVRQNFSQF